jgi:flavodoxin
MKTVVIYKSISGYTKKYAEWIADELEADICKQDSITVKTLLEYDTIIFGGSLHATGIIGLNTIKKNLKILEKKNIIIFATGASPYKSEIIEEILCSNFTDEEQKYITLFYLRGGFNFRKLNFLNKILMTLFKWRLQLKRTRTKDEKGMLTAFLKPVDFTKKEKTKELLSYVRSLSNTI